VSEETLAVSFDTTINYEDFPNTPYPYVVSTWDATGRFKNRIEIDALAGKRRLATSAAGDVLVMLDHGLAKYSSNLEKKGELTFEGCGNISSEHCEVNNYRIDETPKESEILIEEKVANAAVLWTWIDPESLKVDSRASGHWSEIFSAGAGQYLGPVSPRGTQALVSSSGSRTFCSDRCWSAIFVSDDLAFISREKSFEIENLAGDIVARGPLDEPVPEIARARSAPRFAYLTVTGGFTGALAGIFPKLHYNVHVFDIHLMKEVAHWQFSASEKDLHGAASQFGLALSPDGQRAAVLVANTLMMYAVGDPR
jgi:hypothetical protein